MNKIANDSLTRVNVMRAFEGEIFAQNQYIFFSAIAKRERLKNISQIFLELSQNKRNNAKMFYNFVDKADLAWLNYPSCSFSYVSETTVNLEVSKEIEEEYSQFLYPQFAKMAMEEGFEEVYNTFKMIARSGDENRIKLQELQLIPDS